MIYYKNNYIINENKSLTRKTKNHNSKHKILVLSSNFNVDTVLFGFDESNPLYICFFLSCGHDVSCSLRLASGFWYFILTIYDILNTIYVLQKEEDNFYEKCCRPDGWWPGAKILAS